MASVQPAAMLEPGTEPERRGAGGPGSTLVRELALGFGYWLFFLLVLQPGNLFQAAKAGIALSLQHETLRILGASLLGAAVTPLLLLLVRRLPIEGLRHWRQALIHALCLALLSVTLISVAQVLAPWVLSGRDPRLSSSLSGQLTANGPLLFFCMTAFVAGAHATAFLRRAQHGQALLSDAWALAGRLERRETSPVFPAAIPVKTRGKTLMIAVDEIDWVETQGNYLALHVGPAAHLVRATLARFQANLDPQRFVRTHRTILVAVDRVREVVAAANGDADIRLRDGTSLRVSRTYRAELEAALRR